MSTQRTVFWIRSLQRAFRSVWKLVVLLAVSSTVFAQGDVTVTVVADSATGAAITQAYRWILEEDATLPPDPPGSDLIDLPSLSMHTSYMPVAASGHTASGSSAQLLDDEGAPITLDTSKRYYLSILPDADYAMSGKQVLFDSGTSANVTVVVNSQPIPTAQIFIRAYEDIMPLNDAFDAGEPPLGGFTVFIYDNAGQLLTDVYGNPLGTTYIRDGDDWQRDTDGAPVVERLGDGTLRTMTAAEAGDPIANPYGVAEGELVIKNLAPGKYGVRVVPPPAPPGEGWQQTSTIEGTAGQDVWVKALEPRYFAEFGPFGHHAEFGFVRPFSAFAEGSGDGTVTGTVVNLRMSRPPDTSFHSGAPLSNCWVGLNDPINSAALYAGPCDADGTFSIPNVPAGSYQLAVFDTYLDLIFKLQAIEVGTAASPSWDVGDVETFRWFATLENFIYLDENGNGLREVGEQGIPELALNFRYRDGSIYNANVTDLDGAFPVEEQFPFFSWLVAESDYARLKPTGLTVTVDAGGPVDAVSIGANANAIGGGYMSPQYQANDGTGTNCGPDGGPSGECLTRTELGPALTEGYNLFLGATTRLEWGRQPYGTIELDGEIVNENGGISGVVYYATTRAENDPRFAAAEEWEPGVPRVQVNLYRADADGNIQDVNAPEGIQLADVDNYPFDDFPGPGDVDHNVNGVFDMGDAIEVTHTDSWDDNVPTGCPAGNYHPSGNPETDPFYLGGQCYDGLRNYNQARPAVFDGGFGFGIPFSDQWLAPGFYVIETNTPPGYELLKEEDKNVDFGDAFTVNPLALPPICVGELREVPVELALFPGIETEAGGQMRPLCDRKLVQHSDGKNTAADFFVFTETPVAGHVWGFILNDLANEFDPNNINFGEKWAPSHIPVSIRDWAGNEVYHTKSDRYGRYSAIVPSSYTINIPMASGVSPNMLQVCLNSPTMEDPANPGVMIPDPNFNKQFTQFCYTFNFNPGTTTYLDTPVLPVAAFTGPNNWQLDTEYPDGTPVIHSVTGPGNGPVADVGQQITIVAVGDGSGTVLVPDPNALRVDGNNNTLIPRDHGFGGAEGEVWLGELQLAINSWSAGIITATIPADATTGQLRIVRGDNDQASVHAITVHVTSETPIVVGPGESIQDAIELATAGQLIVVSPGIYFESLVITKPIRLQGTGAGSTIINAAQSPSDKIARWRETINYLTNCTYEVGLLEAQENNTTDPAAPCGYRPGTGLFAQDEGAAILVAPREGVFGATNQALIDGFTITGADQGGGIVVNAHAQFLEIANNRIENNQSTVGAAGIQIGIPSLLQQGQFWADGDNDYVNIHNNHVAQNGSLFEPGGGIGIYTGADNYRVVENWIAGNFGQGDGGGLAHYGLSDNGLIADNWLLFNQSFDQTAGTGGNGGGLLIAGHEPAANDELQLTPGAGNVDSSVRILRNRIQGNSAGSGDGGGIAMRLVNGADVVANPTVDSWFRVDLLSNMIVNNSAGWTAGGVSLLDALNVRFVGNTVVNNDATGTAAAAFCDPNSFDSCPWPAGIVSRAHTAGLASVLPLTDEGLPAYPFDYSQPEGGIRNSIVAGNRSLYWQGSAPSQTGFSSGILVPIAESEPFDDFGVLDSAELDPQLLASKSIVSCGADVGVISGEDPLIEVGSCNNGSSVEGLFVNAYRNVAPLGAHVAADGIVTSTPENIVLPDGTSVPGGEFPILAAAALDEGGNFIDVHSGPLAFGGDYHLFFDTVDENGIPLSLAIDAGGNVGRGILREGAALDFDYDPRPLGIPQGQGNNATVAFDIGADEVLYENAIEGDVANFRPEIILPSNNEEILAYAGIPFRYQVVAYDPDDEPLSYELCRNGQGGGPSGGCTAGNVPAGMSIDTLTGLISWNDPIVTGNGPNRSFEVTVSDAIDASDAHSFRLVVIAEDTPTANPDDILVTSGGAFSVTAPGVLANDENPSPSPLTALLVDGLTPVPPYGGDPGTVLLRPDGGFEYAPVSDFIGIASFSYQASNDAGTSPIATTSLTRWLGVDNATYNPMLGAINLSGAGQPGDTLIFADNATDLSLGANVTVDGSGSWSAELAETNWTRGGPITVSVMRQDGAELQLISQVSVLPLSTSGFNGALTSVNVQCPWDDGDGQVVGDPDDVPTDGVVCRHLAAGDGFSVMADGTELYGFSFNDVSEYPATEAIGAGLVNAHFPAPTLEFDEGDEVYLTLTNVGMVYRPDLFDPHTIHWHGFPNAATVFDGVPDSSIAINQSFSLTYYYFVEQPGTFMYHCHVEATEHMQMGMLGNLYVHPAQNGQNYDGFTQFVYNDGDGSTGYDVEFPIQIGSFDSDFHNASLAVQPLPFAEMDDDYHLLNGRGYPDTADVADVPVASGGDKEGSGVDNATESSQVVSSRIEATVGQRILLRISNLNVTQFSTLMAPGLTMQVVGTGAAILRGPGGTSADNLYYETNSVTLGGGEAVDVLIDTTGVAAGTYLLYSSNLNQLSNGDEDFGGMMTEIVINE